MDKKVNDPGATQMNFESKKQYKTPDFTALDRAANVTHAQSNFDGGATTKQGGVQRSSGQTNFESEEQIKVKTKLSHFGEKEGTGSQGGY